MTRVWLTKDQAVARIRRRRWAALEQIPSLTIEEARQIAAAYPDDIFELVYEDCRLVDSMVRFAAATLKTTDDLDAFGLTLKDVQDMYAYLDPDGQSEYLWEHCYRDYPHLTTALAKLVRSRGLLEVPEPDPQCFWPRELIGWQEIADVMDCYQPWFVDNELEARVTRKWNEIQFKTMDPNGYAKWTAKHVRICTLTIDGLLTRDVQ